MIFIGYNYEGYTISIVNAKSRELADAYWQGAQIIPHTVKCLEKDFASLDEHPTGVYPILRTKEQNLSSLYHQYSRQENISLVIISKS